MSRSFKFHYLITYALKISLLGFVCGFFFNVFLIFSFLIFSVVFSTFFIVDIISRHSTILLIMSFVIHGFIALISTYPNQTTHTFWHNILYISHCTSTFPPSHSIAMSFSSRLFCNLCLFEHVTFPNPILIFPFVSLLFSSI